MIVPELKYTEQTSLLTAFSNGVSLDTIMSKHPVPFISVRDKIVKSSKFPAELEVPNTYNPFCLTFKFSPDIVKPDTFFKDFPHGMVIYKFFPEFVINPIVDKNDSLILSPGAKNVLLFSSLLDYGKWHKK